MAGFRELPGVNCVGERFQVELKRQPVGATVDPGCQLGGVAVGRPPGPESGASSTTVDGPSPSRSRWSGRSASRARRIVSRVSIASPRGRVSADGTAWTGREGRGSLRDRSP